MNRGTALVVALAVWPLPACQREPPSPPLLTPEECSRQGGDVVNAMRDFGSGKKPEDFCASPDRYLGRVTGMKCDCVCCR